jgi:hypothetical protein
MPELSRFKHSSLLDAPWKKAIAVTVFLSLLAVIVVFPVLHSRGHLGRHGSVYHAPRSSIAMTRCILMSSRSSNSAQTATHYINVTTIQTGADILWDYAGRYQDAIWNNTGPGPEGRTLDGISFNWTGNMTNELCADACAGYQYFGTEFCERQACPLHNFLERVKYGGMQKLILCGCRFAVLLWK